MELGERLYQLRRERRMSQEALADALGVSRQSVSKWENGASTPDLDKLVRLGELFGLSLDELVKGQAPPTAEGTEAAVRPPCSKGRMIAAVVLLVCGGLAALLLFATTLLYFAVWLLLAGVLCLRAREHLGILLGGTAWLFALLFFETGTVLSPWDIFSPAAYRFYPPFLSAAGLAGLSSFSAAARLGRQGRLGAVRPEQSHAAWAGGGPVFRRQSCMRLAQSQSAGIQSFGAGFWILLSLALSALQNRSASGPVPSPLRRLPSPALCGAGRLGALLWPGSPGRCGFSLLHVCSTTIGRFCFCCSTWALAWAGAAWERRRPPQALKQAPSRPGRRLLVISFGRRAAGPERRPPRQGAPSPGLRPPGAGRPESPEAPSDPSGQRVR